MKYCVWVISKQKVKISANIRAFYVYIIDDTCIYIILQKIIEVCIITLNNDCI